MGLSALREGTSGERPSPLLSHEGTEISQSLQPGENSHQNPPLLTPWSQNWQPPDCEKYSPAVSATVCDIPVCDNTLSRLRQRDRRHVGSRAHWLLGWPIVAGQWERRKFLEQPLSQAWVSRGNKGYERPVSLGWKDEGSSPWRNGWCHLWDPERDRACSERPPDPGGGPFPRILFNLFWGLFGMW